MSLDTPTLPRPLRVALLHNIISPHVVPLFARLARQPGIDLTVYFLAETDRNRRWETTIGDDFRYEILPHWALRVGRTDLNTFFVNPTIVSKLIAGRFDLVISVGWDSFAAQAAFFLCELLGKPYVLWSGSTANEPSWRRTISRPLVQLMVRGAAAWIAYGTRAREYLAQLGADPSRVAVAYNTVDTAWYQAQADALRPHRQDIRRQLGLGAGPVVLYVGQLIERKGARDLLAAHERLVQTRPDIQLVMVGYGPLEAVLRRQVDDRQTPNVVFAGHVPIPLLPRYYAAADVFALPSHEEVWGLVLNEAAASGLPLITTDAVGAGPDLVQPGVNGFIVPAAAPARLAVALGEVLERSTEMGEASRVIVSKASYEQNEQAVLAAIRTAAPRPVFPSSASSASPAAGRKEQTIHAMKAAAARIPLVRRVGAKTWALFHYWPHLRANTRQALAFLFADPELHNFTYEIANLDELADFMAQMLGINRDRAAGYIHELEQDAAFRAELEGLLRRRPDRKNVALYGRRAGWYCAVRALKPRLTIETGVHDGLGSAIILRALERNRAEGHAGRLIGIDIDPPSGWLVPARLREHFTLVIEDSATALPRIAAEEPIDLFIHDSWHSDEHESGEYRNVLRGLAPDAVILSDNVHATSALERFALQQNRPFAFWKEQPVGHFYPGAGIGVSVASLDLAGEFLGASR